MNPKFKLGAYAVLLVLAVWFGLAFRYYYEAATREPVVESSDTTPAPASPLSTNLEATNSDVTNTIASSTNVATNLTAQATNAAGEVTNTTPATTNIASAPPAAKPPRKAIPTDSSSAKGAMIEYLGGLILALIALGLLIASDVAHFVGSTATDYLYLDVGDAMRDPLYEQAEAAWANGTYLDAIQLLRDYLKRNPRELHAALRIGEIYEKDLKNYLAAALEYEEVLKHKLPSERWGWAAIHLCNLYSKLNHHDKTLDLLHRIVNEYPKTAAAKKARVRLGIQELEEDTQDGPAAGTAEEGEVKEEAAPPPSPPDSPASNLPPGFRPKK
jgi:TolA-binding protein